MLEQFFSIKSFSRRIMFFRNSSILESTEFLKISSLQFILTSPLSTIFQLFFLATFKTLKLLLTTFNL